MKITKAQLKEIIKEELEKPLKEYTDPRLDDCNDPGAMERARVYTIDFQGKEEKIHAVSYICLAQAIKEKEEEGLTLAEEPIVGIGNLIMDRATKEHANYTLKKEMGKLKKDRE